MIETDVNQTTDKALQDGGSDVTCLGSFCLCKRHKCPYYLFLFEVLIFFFTVTLRRLLLEIMGFRCECMDMNMEKQVEWLLVLGFYHHLTPFHLFVLLHPIFFLIGHDSLKI